MGRITTISQSYYEDSSGVQGQTEARTWRNTEADEQPYGPRKLTVSEEWQEVDFGWVLTPSLLIVYNPEGPNPKDGSGQSLEVGVQNCGAVVKDELPAVTPVAILSPRKDFMVWPCPNTRYFVRSRGGHCRYEVTAYPS